MKYVIFIILGILIFIFFNNYNTFSIGGQESDDEEEEGGQCNLSCLQRLLNCLSTMPYNPIRTIPNSEDPNSITPNSDSDSEDPIRTTSNLNLESNTVALGDVVLINVRQFYQEGFHDTANRRHMPRLGISQLASQFGNYLSHADENTDEVDYLYGYVRDPHDPRYAYSPDQRVLLDIYR